MISPFENNSLSFIVVVNSSMQYSIWPHDWSIPLGWEAISEPTSRDNCLSIIERNWNSQPQKKKIQVMKKL